MFNVSFPVINRYMYIGKIDFTIKIRNESEISSFYLVIYVEY